MPRTGGRLDPNLIFEGTTVFFEHRTMAGWKVDLSLVSTRHVDGVGFELSHRALALFTNAAQAMQGRGTLTVRTRDGSGTVAIEVGGQGPGIPAFASSNLLDEHVTTKQGAQGLGLSVARSLLSGMGGTVVAHHAPDSGARFVLTILPVWPQDWGTGPGPSSPKPSPGAPLSMLFAESS